jgi:hypothetical protein
VCRRVTYLRVATMSMAMLTANVAVIVAYTCGIMLRIEPRSSVVTPDSKAKGSEKGKESKEFHCRKVVGCL